MKEEIKNSSNKQTIFKTMVSYCLKCRRKNAVSENPKVARTKSGRIILLSKYAIVKNRNL